MNQPIPPETVARILALAQQTPRITQTEIAWRCGVTQSFVSRVCGENGLSRRSERVDHRIIVELSQQRPRVTQREIARRVGYHPSHIAKIIQAHKDPEQTPGVTPTSSADGG